MAETHRAVLKERDAMARARDAMAQERDAALRCELFSQPALAKCTATHTGCTRVHQFDWFDRLDGMRS
jgi:hypothetical protein